MSPITPGGRHLGRLAPLANSRAPKLAAYLAAPAAALPAAPESCDWTKGCTGLDNPYFNDRVGDCTIADACHRLIVWSAAAGRQITPTVDDALAAYRAVSGYDPATGANDTGAAIETVLEYCRTVGIAGRKIDSFASFDFRDLNLVRLCCVWFGGVTIGVNLPYSAETQTDAGQPWTVDLFSRPAGRHDVPILSYDGNYFYVDTWGTIQAVSPEFLLKYTEEAWVVVSPEFLLPDGSGTPYNHLNLDQLRADCAAIAAA